jgi:hypothetical protein
MVRIDSGKPERDHPGSRDGGAARRRVFASLVAAVAGFALALAVLHAVLDLPPQIEGYSEKLTHYQRHADQYSVLFVGSSRVFRHMVPAAFDEAAVEAGLEVRSFNIGMDALNLIELKTLLGAIGRTGNGSSRYVLIEPTLGFRLRARNVATVRAAYFHDFDNTVEEIGALHFSRSEWRPIGRSLLACLYHYAFVGRLASALLPPATGSPRGILEEEFAASRGFEALNKTEGRWYRFVQDNFDRLSNRIRERPPPAERLIREFEPANETVLDAVLPLRERGFEPIFMISPILQLSGPLRAFEEFHRRRDPGIPLFSYIGRLDEIYDPSFWSDPGHMNGKGAEIFSRRLGRDFAAWVQAREGR